jgi:hypothetical protein
LLHHLPATAKCAIMLSQNYFSEPNRHILTFLHPILRAKFGYIFIWMIATLATSQNWKPLL